MKSVECFVVCKKEIDLYRKISNAYKFIDSHHHRKELHCIHVSDNTVEATDGHGLIRITGNTDGLPNGLYLPKRMGLYWYLFKEADNLYPDVTAVIPKKEGRKAINVECFHDGDGIWSSFLLANLAKEGVVINHKLITRLPDSSYTAYIGEPLQTVMFENDTTTVLLMPLKPNK